jgi:hypothetical protein
VFACVCVFACPTASLLQVPVIGDYCLCLPNLPLGEGLVFFGQLLDLPGGRSSLRQHRVNLSLQRFRVLRRG